METTTNKTYFWVTIFNLGYPQIQMASEDEMEGQNIFCVKTLSISHTHKRIQIMVFCCCLMADLAFIPLVFWHPNTVLVIH
jgi:hypothetical protein